jgi:hypothetical protein
MRIIKLRPERPQAAHAHHLCGPVQRGQRVPACAGVQREDAIRSWTGSRRTRCDTSSLCWPGRRSWFRLRGRVASVDVLQPNQRPRKVDVRRADAHGPTSTTTAADETNSGVHDGSVCEATRISPGSRSSAWPGSLMTRAGPVATPEHAGTRCRTVPSVAVSSTSGPGAHRSQSDLAIRQRQEPAPRRDRPPGKALRLAAAQWIRSAPRRCRTPHWAATVPACGGEVVSNSAFLRRRCRPRDCDCRGRRRQRHQAFDGRDPVGSSSISAMTRWALRTSTSALTPALAAKADDTAMNTDRSLGQLPPAGWNSRAVTDQPSWRSRGSRSFWNSSRNRRWSWPGAWNTRWFSPQST